MNNRGLVVILGALVLVVLISGLLGGMMGPGMAWNMGPGIMWGYGGSSTAPSAGGWGWSLAMALGMVLMVAFWATVVVGVVLLARWALGVQPSSPTEGPQAILRRRYAAGEIDQPTYERMKRELDADSRS